MSSYIKHTYNTKKEDLLNSEFLKQFRSGEELNNFIHQLKKRGIEQLLEGEMDDHLGYEKHERTKAKNARNGHWPKLLKPAVEKPK